MTVCTDTYLCCMTFESIFISFYPAKKPITCIDLASDENLLYTGDTVGNICHFDLRLSGANKNFRANDKMHQQFFFFFSSHQDACSVRLRALAVVCEHYSCTHRSRILHRVDSIALCEFIISNHENLRSRCKENKEKKKLFVQLFSFFLKVYAKQAQSALLFDPTVPFGVLTLEYD